MSGGTIVVGLTAALGRPADAEIEAQGRLHSAAFERAAIDIGAGGDPSLYRGMLKRMLAEAVTAASH
jgi:hypothetical protein